MTDRCEWPHCSQQTWDSPLCYYHGKLANGVIDGRDVLPDSRGKSRTERQELLTRNLQVVKASEEVVERSTQSKSFATRAQQGGGIPRGRLHS